MSFIKKHWVQLSLGLLVALGLGVRLYNISATQTFLEDEGRDVLIVKRMVDTGRPVLLGPQTSIGSMYLGPFYYYFITPALILSRMDPVGPAILVAITGSLTIWVLYKVTSMWFGRLAGGIAATLYALMPLTVSFTRNSWNPNLAPLVSLLILYSVDKLRSPDKKNLWWFGAVGFLTGILVQLHYMALVYVGFYGLLLVLWWFKKKECIKGAVIGIAGFILAMSPFIIFELRNDWVNTQAITRFIQAKDSPNIRYELPFWLWRDKVVKVSDSVFGGLFSRGDYRPADMWTPYLTAIAMLVSLVGLCTSPVDRKRKAFLLSSVFGSIALLGIYQENIHVHYLGYMFAISYMAFVSLIANKEKVLACTGLAIGIGLLIYSVPVTWGNITSTPNNQIPRARDVAKYIEMKANGRAYNIVSSPKTSTTPYQYFAFLNNNKPSNDWAETVFMVCQDAPCSDGDMTSKQMFITGPAHPSLSGYVGHPLANYVMQGVQVISNEHVSNGVWVAELALK